MQLPSNAFRFSRGWLQDKSAERENARWKASGFMHAVNGTVPAPLYLFLLLGLLCAARIREKRWGGETKLFSIDPPESAASGSFTAHLFPRLWLLGAACWLKRNFYVRFVVQLTYTVSVEGQSKEEVGWLSQKSMVALRHCGSEVPYCGRLNLSCSLPSRILQSVIARLCMAWSTVWTKHISNC